MVKKGDQTNNNNIFPKETVLLLLIQKSMNIIIKNN